MINQSISKETASNLLDALQKMLKAYGDKNTVMWNLRNKLEAKIQNSGGVHKAGDGNDTNIIRNGVLSLLKPSRFKYNVERHIFDAYIAYLKAILSTKKEKEAAAIAFEIVVVVGKKGVVKQNKPNAFYSFNSPTDIVIYVLSQLIYTNTISDVLDTLPIKSKNAPKNVVEQSSKASVIETDEANETLKQELEKSKNELAENEKLLAEALELLKTDNSNDTQVKELEVQVETLKQQLKDKESALSEHIVVPTSEVSDKEAYEAGISLIRKIFKGRSCNKGLVVLERLNNSDSELLIDFMIQGKNFANLASMSSNLTPLIKKSFFEDVLLSQRTIFVLKNSEMSQHYNSGKTVISAEDIEKGCKRVEVIFQTSRVRFNQSAEYYGIGAKKHLATRLDDLRWFCKYLGRQVYLSHSVLTTSLEKSVLSAEQRYVPAKGSQHDIEGMLNSGDVMPDNLKLGVIAQNSAIETLFPESGGIELYLNKIRSSFNDLQTSNEGLSAQIELDKANLVDLQRELSDVKADNKQRIEDLEADNAKLFVRNRQKDERIAELEAQLKQKEGWLSPDLVSQRLQTMFFDGLNGNQ